MMKSTRDVLVVACGLSLVAALSGCNSEEGGSVTPTAQQGTTDANVSLGTTSELTPQVPATKSDLSQAQADRLAAKRRFLAGAEVTATTAPARPKPVAAPKPADPETFAIKLEPRQLDLGLIGGGETGRGTVKLVNSGTSPIKVVNARTSCGCTTAKVPRGRTLEPGESADVDINLSGKGRHGLKMNKTVTFIFEDMDLQQWTLTLPVRGEVFAYVKLEPFVLDSEDGDMGRVTLTATDDQAFRVMNMHPPVIDGLPTEAKLEHVLEFSWDKWRDTGSSRKMAFYLDHPKVPSLTGTVKVPFNTARAKPVLPPPVRDPTKNLSFAIGRGDVADIIEQIMSGKLEVDTLDLQGRTVLTLAARYGNVELLAVCLAAGGDVNAKDRALMTPLMWAGHSKNAVVTKVLIEAGAEIEAFDRIGGTALCWAAGFGDGASVQALLEAGANADVSSELVGFTPLIWAAGYNADPGAAQALIDAGAQLDRVDNDGSTALMHAARTGRAENVMALMNVGAATELINAQGKAALLIAAKAPQAKVDTLRALIEGGASLEAKDYQGLTALDLARRRTDANGAEVVTYLESVMAVAGSAQKYD